MKNFNRNSLVMMPLLSILMLSPSDMQVKYSNYRSPASVDSLQLDLAQAQTPMELLQETQKEELQLNVQNSLASSIDQLTQAKEEKDSSVQKNITETQPSEEKVEVGPAPKIDMGEDWSKIRADKKEETVVVKPEKEQVQLHADMSQSNFVADPSVKAIKKEIMEDVPLKEFELSDEEKLEAYVKEGSSSAPVKAEPAVKEEAKVEIVVGNLPQIDMNEDWLKSREEMNKAIASPEVKEVVKVEEKKVEAPQIQEEQIGDIKSLLAEVIKVKVQRGDAKVETVEEVLKGIIERQAKAKKTIGGRLAPTDPKEVEKMVSQLAPLFKGEDVNPKLMSGEKKNEVIIAKAEEEKKTEEIKEETAKDKKAKKKAKKVAKKAKTESAEENCSHDSNLINKIEKMMSEQNKVIQTLAASVANQAPANPFQMVQMQMMQMNQNILAMQERMNIQQTMLLQKSAYQYHTTQEAPAPQAQAQQSENLSSMITQQFQAMQSQIMSSLQRPQMIDQRQAQWGLVPQIQFQADPRLQMNTQGNGSFGNGMSYNFGGSQPVIQQVAPMTRDMNLLGSVNVNNLRGVNLHLPQVNFQAPNVSTLVGVH